MLIRRATHEDAATLQALAASTFTETFGHLYPPEDLDFFLRDSYALVNFERDLADPRKAMWLLQTDDGRALGHAFAGPNTLPHADAQAGDGELKRLYLLRECHNGGWGGKLFDVAMQWLQKDGSRTLWIGVWSRNFGAQRFYARRGFEQVGGYEFPVGRTLDDEFILRRAPLNLRAG